MSEYLARLKRLESGKNSAYAPDGEPPKPPKGSFGPFDSMPPTPTAKKFSHAKPMQADAATPYEREIVGWLERIGEDDPVIFGETLAKCRANPDALTFFLGLARGDDETVH